METPSLVATPKEICTLSTRELVDRVLLFIEEAANRRFYRYQRKLARRVVESLLKNDGATVTALFSRQSGKSEAIACLGIGLPLILPMLAKAFPDDKRFKPFINGFLFGIFAPTNKHSGIIYMRIRDRVNSQKFEAFMNDPEIGVFFTHSRGDSFSYSNGSMVQAFTASETVLNEGFTFHLIVTDESQKFSASKVNKELRPMLAAYNGTMVEIGTAFMSRCQFYEDIKQNQEAERKDGHVNHFQFDYKQVVKDRAEQYRIDANPAHLAYEKFVDKEVARLGGAAAAHENEAFRMNFELEWENAFQNALNMVAFKALGREDLELDYISFSGGRYVAGLDVAKDSDSTWLTVGWVDTAHPVIDTSQWAEDSDDDPAVYYNVTIVGWLVMQGNFESDQKGLGQYDTIVNYLRRFPRVDTIAVDATGKGDPVAERMQVLLPNVTVIPYHFSLTSKHVLYRWYFQEIGAKRFHYPAGPETQQDPIFQDFIYQHDGLVREYSGQYLRVFAGDPEEHDDAPDSAALMLHASKHQGIPMLDFGDMGAGGAGGRVTEIEGGGTRNPLASTGASRYRSRY